METPKLPKFLIADNSQESMEILYVVHTEEPRCIIQCGLDGIYSDQYIHWIDAAPSEELTDELLDLADEFLENELMDPDGFDYED